jgi:hypothetical protein
MTNIDAAALVTQHVPPQFLAEAVRAVDQAAQTHVTNTDRREWAVQFLRNHLHTPEYLARLLVELAVAAVKTQRNEGPRT